jgi:hypothetical protein
MPEPAEAAEGELRDDTTRSDPIFISFRLILLFSFISPIELSASAFAII